MISQSKAQRIEKLLGKLESYRQIARTVGVSRDTVQRIASGQRPDYEALCKATEKAKEPQEVEARPPARCHVCGAMVIVPCRACALRKKLRQNGATRSGTLLHAHPEDASLTLMLRGEERQRYECVRARRLFLVRLGVPLQSLCEDSDLP